MERKEKNDSQPDTRERILRAARKVFGELGLGKSRIDRLAEEAGVNRAMINYYFEGKENLYKTVLEDCIREIFQAGEAQLEATDDFVVSVNEILDNIFNYLIENEDVLKMATREAIDGGAALREIRENNPDLFRPQFQRISALMQKAVDQGIFRDLDTNMMLTALFGMVIFYVLGRGLMDLLFDPDEEPDYFEPENWLEHFRRVLLLVLLKPISEPKRLRGEPVGKKRSRSKT